MKTFHITLLLIPITLFAQKQHEYWVAPNTAHGQAITIESLKDGDCIIISYVPRVYNRTVTPRDDKDLGFFYFASGKDCAGLFETTFQSMNHHAQGEKYNPVSLRTLDLDSFNTIQTLTMNETIAEGGTKLYITYFYKDNMTTDPRDDKFLGMDFVIDSGDPDAIESPFRFEEIKEAFKQDPAVYDLISRNTYYKLREMIVNENLIVNKLRADKKLKDITPPVDQKITRVKLKNSALNP